jgi:hypothetical protein
MTTTIGSELVPAPSITRWTSSAWRRSAFLVGQPTLDHHTRRRVLGQLVVKRAAGRDLQDESRIGGHHAQP